MKKVFALLLALVMLLSLTACGGNGGSEAGGESSDPVMKDTFVAALGGQPDYLDPAIASDSVSSCPISLMYHLLFQLDEQGNVVENAVETYSVSDDGLVYTLKLVDGNKWSDGQPVKASDYEFGAKRTLGMGSALSYYSYFIKDYVVGGAELEGKDVAEMDALGFVADDEANTLTITLNAPCPYYTGLLTSVVFAPVRADFATEHESTWADSTDVPVNGAYVPTKIASNEELVFVKNEHFVNADKVVTPNLVLKVMEDMDAQLMAYQTGEIDMALSVDAAVASAQYAGQEDLVVTASVINYYVQMNSASWSTAPALTDVRVRRALQLALNRDEIVAALDAGVAYYPLYGYVPMGMAGVNGDFRGEVDATAPYVYTDVEEAKALMEAAGYNENNRLALVYKYNANNMHDTVAQVMQQQWKEIYVDVTFETLEVQSFFAERDENGNYELARGAMSADYMDPTTFLCMLISSAQQKPVVTDATYDALIAEADTLEGAARIEKLHEAEKYLVEEMAYTIPVFGYSSVYLVNPGVSNVGYDPTGNTFFGYVSITE